MESYSLDDLDITLDKEGAPDFTKVSYPVRYGRYAEIKTPDHLFQFNLNGEIKYIQGRGKNWPHPAEWLKRTVANDWIYYSAGDYKGVYEAMGEYYIPCLSYPSNSLFGENPFEDRSVKAAFQSWWTLQNRLKAADMSKLPQPVYHFLSRVIRSDAESLNLRALRLHDLIGTDISVLPPDTRHVDYEVIPLIIADGCLYKCGFCRVKSGRDFSVRSRQHVMEEIEGLRRFYDQDLPNMNSIFLGNHDALCAGREIIEFAATQAYETFKLDRSHMRNPRIFLFGSADSIIDAKESLLEFLNTLPFITYINIGLESGDPTTLATLKKPLSAEKVREAFTRMIDINKRYEKIEVTANFLFGPELPLTHLPSLFDLTRERVDPLSPKGCIYFSPLIQEDGKQEGNRRALLRKFKAVKAQSPLPTYLYLIQRL